MSWAPGPPPAISGPGLHGTYNVAIPCKRTLTDLDRQSDRLAADDLDDAVGGADRRRRIEAQTGVEVPVRQRVVHANSDEDVGPCRPSAERRGGTGDVGRGRRGVNQRGRKTQRRHETRGRLRYVARRARHLNAMQSVISTSLDRTASTSARCGMFLRSVVCQLELGIDYNT